MNSQGNLSVRLPRCRLIAHSSSPALNFQEARGHVTHATVGPARRPTGVNPLSISGICDPRALVQYSAPSDVYQKALGISRGAVAYFPVAPPLRWPALKRRNA